MRITNEQYEMLEQGRATDDGMPIPEEMEWEEDDVCDKGDSDVEDYENAEAVRLGQILQRT